MRKFKPLSYLLIGILIGSLIPIQSLVAQSPIKLIINGKTIQCDVPPQNVNGRVLVPARYVAENLNATVEWDGVNRVVRVNSKVEQKTEQINQNQTQNNNDNSNVENNPRDNINYISSDDIGKYYERDTSKGFVKNRWVDGKYFIDYDRKITHFENYEYYYNREKDIFYWADYKAILIFGETVKDYPKYKFNQIQQ